jgi:hypothetical protein
MFIQTLWPILCNSFSGILNLIRKPNAWELWRALARAGFDIGAEGIASCGKPSGLA